MRREKRLGVVQASPGGVAQGRGMKGQKILPALPRGSGGGIVEQIGFRREPLQDGHGDSRGFRVANERE